MATMFVTEFDLIRWICKCKDGVTVVGTAKRFNITRQCAYGRLERLTKKEHLSYVYEESTGPRDQVRYRPTSKVRVLVGRKWTKVSPRLMRASL